MTLNHRELIDAEALLAEIEEPLKSGDVDAILAWCLDVAGARTARVEATVTDPPPAPPEPDPEPVAVDEINEPANVETPSGAFFGTGPDVHERVLERQAMQTRRPGSVQAAAVGAAPTRARTRTFLFGQRSHVGSVPGAGAERSPNACAGAPVSA